MEEKFAEDFWPQYLERPLVETLATSSQGVAYAIQPDFDVESQAKFWTISIALVSMLVMLVIITIIIINDQNSLTSSPQALVYICCQALSDFSEASLQMNFLIRIRPRQRLEFSEVHVPESSRVAAHVVIFLRNTLRRREIALSLSMIASLSLSHFCAPAIPQLIKTMISRSRTHKNHLWKSRDTWTRLYELYNWIQGKEKTKKHEGTTPATDTFTEFLVFSSNCVSEMRRESWSFCTIVWIWRLKCRLVEWSQPANN